MGTVNKFFNQELHCFHHKIASVGYADCIVEWEEEGRELVTESAGDVAGNEATDGCRNAKGGGALLHLWGPCVGRKGRHQ